MVLDNIYKSERILFHENVTKFYLVHLSFWIFGVFKAAWGKRYEERYSGTSVVNLAR